MNADRERFLLTPGEVCGRTGWRVHAFVLMSNHYHLLLETRADEPRGGDAVVSDDVDGALQRA